MTAPFKCHDGLCGQLDCARCYPETYNRQDDLTDDEFRALIESCGNIDEWDEDDFITYP